MKRILLADDSQQALRLGERLLAGQGIEVVSVTDGATALRRLSDVDPDLLITDVYLPAKNGFELARFIKAQPEWKHVHVVFAAGVADEFDEQDAKNAGAEAILRKPFEASALMNVVQPLLEQAEASRAKRSGSDSGIDRNMVRAAVTLAIESAIPVLIDELTDRVMVAVRQSNVKAVPAPAARAEAKAESEKQASSVGEAQVAPKNTLK
ncbi:MAG TPA: response regulator [Bryobacteraceae bacterium]|jgi:CheY-like chemotaxis protein